MQRRPLPYNESGPGERRPDERPETEAEVPTHSRYDAAIERFDAAHREDPDTETHGGEECPKELLYARRMTEWLDRLAPDAPEAVRLAARCQHLERWKLPRSRYPMDRRGYLRWRTELKNAHAERAAELLLEAGYDGETVRRVQSLVRKERLTDDPDTQLLEDVVCLVFLESYFSEFARKHDEEKLIPIVQKTWKKMTPRGHDAAIGLLDALPPEDAALIRKALAGEGDPHEG
jgi:hypothetical protein